MPASNQVNISDVENRQDHILTLYNISAALSALSEQWDNDSHGGLVYLFDVFARDVRDCAAALDNTLQ